MSGSRTVAASALRCTGEGVWMRVLRCIVALALVVALAALVGCSNEESAEETQLEPKISPPVILAEGVLKVGLDLSYPPFGAEVDGKEVGLDIDVAAAVAERLGLRVELVDVGNDYVDALNEDRVDVALGAIPINEAVLADVSFAGSYIDGGPAYFSAVETTQTIRSLGGKVVAAQQGSESFWLMNAMYGEDFAKAYPTLREAVAAVASGEADVVVGDAVVTAYIARDYPSVRFVQFVGEPVPYGIAVSKDADELEAAVREALDGLVADGVLDAIRAKWVAAVPSQEGTVTGVATGEETGTP